MNVPFIILQKSVEHLRKNLAEKIDKAQPGFQLVEHHKKLLSV